MAGKKSMLGVVVEVSVGFILTATLFIASLLLIANANYTGVDPTVKTIVSVVLPTLGAIAIFAPIIKDVKSSF